MDVNTILHKAVAMLKPENTTKTIVDDMEDKEVWTQSGSTGRKNEEYGAGTLKEILQVINAVIVATLENELAFLVYCYKYRGDSKNCHKSNIIKTELLVF